MFYADNPQPEVTTSVMSLAYIDSVSTNANVLYGRMTKKTYDGKICFFFVKIDKNSSNKTFV